MRSEHWQFVFISLPTLTLRSSKKKDGWTMVLYNFMGRSQESMEIYTPRKDDVR
jgi:hypothetical protein